jgi:hypothetical protein
VGKKGGVWSEAESCEDVRRDAENRREFSICSIISNYRHCVLVITKDLTGP